MQGPCPVAEVAYVHLECLLDRRRGDREWMPLKERNLWAVQEQVLACTKLKVFWLTELEVHDTCCLLTDRNHLGRMEALQLSADALIDVEDSWGEEEDPEHWNWREMSTSPSSMRNVSVYRGA